MEKLNVKRTSIYTHNPSLECQLNQDDLATTSTVATLSEETNKPQKPHPFYQNLLEKVRKEKDKDSKEKATLVLHEKQKSSPDGNRPSTSKKPFQKSQSQAEEHHHQGADESFIKRSGDVHGHMPLSIFINNIFQFGQEEKVKKDEIVTVQNNNMTNSSTQAAQSFINRFNNLEEDTDYKLKGHQLSDHPFRHLIFNKQATITKKDFLMHLKKVQKGLIYSKKQIKPIDESKIGPKTVPLDPLPEGMKTLVLDLDGTLVHVADHKRDNQSHVTLKMKVEEDELRTFGIRFRPYLYYFLEKLSKCYEIIIFTAAHASYASAVVNYIDPEKKFIKYVISRDRCLVTKNGYYIKDLRILANRDLKDVLIVDNITHSFCMQINNGVPILNYQDDPDDKELKYLAKYLLKCAEARSLREFNGQALRLDELMDFDLTSGYGR